MLIDRDQVELLRLRAGKLTGPDPTGKPCRRGTMIRRRRRSWCRSDFWSWAPERCWSALERKWSGVLLNCVSFVLDCARRMTWKGQPPEVHQLPERDYPAGVKLSKREMQPWEARLQRKPGLEKYDITITPQTPAPAVYTF